jgi:hypothetical protein
MFIMQDTDHKMPGSNTPYLAAVSVTKKEVI